MAADADGLFAFLDFNFGDAGFFEQFNQFFDFADIHVDFLLSVIQLAKRDSAACRASS